MNVDNEIAKIAKRRGCTLTEAKSYALEIGVKRLATIAKFRKEHPDYAAKAKAKPAAKAKAKPAAKAKAKPAAKAKAKPAKAKPAKAPEVAASERDTIKIPDMTPPEPIAPPDTATV